MKKYQRKSTVHEVIEFHDFKEARKFCPLLKKRRLDNGHTLYFIPTLEGEHEITRGYFIVKGINGEFYGVDPLIFNEIYEEIK